MMNVGRFKGESGVWSFAGGLARKSKNLDGLWRDARTGFEATESDKRDALVLAGLSEGAACGEVVRDGEGAEEVTIATCRAFRGEAEAARYPHRDAVPATMPAMSQL